MAPDHIDLVYRKVGDHHIFASKGIQGLVHVGDTDFVTAYEKVLKALTFHIHQTYKVEAHYDGREGFEALKRRVDAGSACEFLEVAGTPSTTSANY